MKKIFYYDTFIGRIGIADNNGKISDITFFQIDYDIEETELIKRAKEELDEYFDGKRHDFDFPTENIGTEFQMKVWNELRNIPYGKTATYAQIAAAVGNPLGCRAVGGANNKNHIAIVYPCHRVVGADGSLTGYAGGLDVKEKLLELEKKYSYQPGKIAVGVDVGGTAVKIGLFTHDGELIAKDEIKTRQDNNCGFVISDTAEQIFKMLDSNGIDKAYVSGIGLGIPGPVVGGKVKHSVNLHWVSEVDASGIMENITGIKTVVLNDANAAGLGEAWMGSGKDRESMVLVTIGTGIGGAVIINGDVLVGFNGAGGEIGHIIAERTSDRVCNCGRSGCLENYASATGIVKTAKELIEKNGGSSLLNNENVSAKVIFDAAKKGDNNALEAIDIFGKYLGAALANIAVTVDPEIIVLAGGVVKAGNIVSDAVEKYYRKNAFKTVKDTKIVLAKLENDAGIYGAAKAVLNIK
ncbi:Methylated-DNA--protein-cysteine methyltransferase [bioreactor metagenome]|uniref:methylated-DNA--[protein]-cysteine S-methyltransferase n=1 Tax=bioreactor metagenome TaxID=1076179 RepID=A0A645BN14_9ZZZZ|nr:ROK family protein [Candidatus Metalachnospira sp.]